MHSSLTISARTKKFSYFTFKVYFQVIIVQTFLKFLFNQLVVLCNFNTKNSLFIAIEIINEIYFFFYNFALNVILATQQLQINHLYLTKSTCLNSILVETNTLNMIVKMWLF